MIPLLTAVATGCVDQELPLEPAAASETGPVVEPIPSTSFMLTGNDTIWGADQELEVTDASGVTWRIERDGSEGAWTEARIYKNGSYQGELDYEWSGSSLTGFHWSNTGGDWMDTDDDGDVEDTSTGFYEGCIDPDDCDHFGAMSHDCEDEWEEMNESSTYAAGTAGLAAVLVSATSPANPYAVGSVVVAASAGVDAFIALAFWACCELC